MLEVSIILSKLRFSKFSYDSVKKLLYVVSLNRELKVLSRYGTFSNSIISWLTNSIFSESILKTVKGPEEKR